MPVSLSGNWTVQLISLPIDQPQRFVISGATSGNGVYSDEYTTPIPVTGNTWTIDFQEEGTWSGQPGFWISAYNIEQTSIETIGNQEVFYIHVDDYRGGVDLNDMVFKLTRPAPIITPPPAGPPIIVTPPTTVNPPTPDPPIVVPPTPTVLQSGKVWTVIDFDDKLPREEERLIKGIWTGDSGSLITFYTGSVPVSQSYKLDIFNELSGSCDSEMQFSIAYGHFAGSGSSDLGGYDWLTPAKATYNQFQQICLGDQKKFKIGTKELNHIYVIGIKRDRYGDKIDEGNIELNIAHLSGSLFQAGGGARNSHTGSNVKLAGNGQILRLIDDSTVNLSSLSDFAYSTSYIDISSSKSNHYGESGEYFFMISGSLEDGVLYDEATPIVYGLLYPKLGIIVLDGDKLDSDAGFLTVTGSDLNGRNHEKLFTAISGAALYTDLSGDYLGFQARKTEIHYSEYYYIRVKNQDYNYTNNPTYVSGSDQYLIDDFQNGKNKVYIQGIGLYNDNHELLAIGKVSKSVIKTPTEEALFTVRLSYGPDAN